MFRIVKNPLCRGIDILDGDKLIASVYFGNHLSAATVEAIIRHAFDAEIKMEEPMGAVEQKIVDALDKSIEEIEEAHTALSASVDAHGVALHCMKVYREHRKKIEDIIEGRDKPDRETSPEISSIAARIIKSKRFPVGSIVEVTSEFVDDAISLAASALGQDQTKGQNSPRGFDADRSPPSVDGDW